MTVSHSANSLRFTSIQIARAIAALAVLIFHSHFAVAAFYPQHKVPFFTAYGWMGVDLFFVVSGFVIAHITSSSLFEVGPYFIKRFFRIYPLYWMFLAIAVYLHFYENYNLGGGDYTTETLVKSFAILPLKDHPWYEVGWTLEYEILFYTIAGIVLSFAGHWTLCAILFVAGTAGIILNMLASSKITVGFWDWHLLSPGLLEFAAGVAAYKARLYLGKFGVAIPAVYFVAFLLIAINLVNTDNVLSHFATAAVAISAAALITMLLNMEVARMLNGGISAALTVIGNASFSLYLVHWIIVTNSGALKWYYLFALPQWTEEPWRLMVMTCCVMIAILMYYFIEVPLIATGHFVARFAGTRRSDTSANQQRLQNFQ